MKRAGCAECYSSGRQIKTKSSNFIEEYMSFKTTGLPHSRTHFLQSRHGDETRQVKRGQVMIPRPITNNWHEKKCYVYSYF